MTALHVIDMALVLVLLMAAALAVGRRALFASIACFVSYGIVVALAWLRLGAVDVALAEVAIGAGLTGVLLMGAWSGLRRHRRGACEGARSPGRRCAAAVVASVFSTMLGLAAWHLRDTPTGLHAQVQAQLPDSGVGNPVTAVLLNFRAWDTLLESMVLLLAVVVVWALTPARAWGQRPGPPHHARPDGVMASFGRLLPPLGLMMAVYVVWVGAEQPGGAFQGGTILAAVWLLAVMAGLWAMPYQSSRRLHVAMVAGPGVFLGIGLAGLAAGSFLALPPAWAKGLILVIECALALSIATALGLLVAGAPRRVAP